jgi:uncharacterized repeat protein (TIGR01451 family)
LEQNVMKQRPVLPLPAVAAAALMLILTLSSLLPAALPAQAAPLAALTETGEPPTPTRTPTATARPAVRATEVPRFADPAVTVSLSTDQVAVGDELLVTLAITNLGNQLAQGVIVEQSLPPYLTLVALGIERGQVVSEGSTIGCWVGDVAPGEVVLCTISVRVLDLPADGLIWNGAQLTSSEDSDLPDNNQPAPLQLLQATIQPTAAALPTSMPPVLPAVLPTTAGGSGAGGLLLLTAGLLLLLIGSRLYRSRGVRG